MRNHSVNTGETFKIAGTQNIATAVSGDTLTITGPNLSSYLTNSSLTIVGDDSTGTTLNTGETIKIAGTQNITTAVSGDTLTITGPDLSSYATQSYVTSQGYITNSPITVVGDDSTGVTLNSGETIKFAGTQNITTAVSGDTLTVTGPNLTGYAQKTDTAITLVGDDSTGTAVTIGETFKIAGGTNITTAVSGDTVTITGAGATLNEFIINLDSRDTDLGSNIFDMNISEVYDSNNLLTITSINTFDLTAGDYIMTNMRVAAIQGDTSNHNIVLRDETNSTDKVTFSSTSTVVTGTRGMVFPGSQFFTVASTATFHIRCTFPVGLASTAFNNTRLQFRKL